MIDSLTNAQDRIAALERQMAELREREQQLSDFIENASVGLHWVDKDGRVVWANQAELDLGGYTREEYIGHHIAEFHADEHIIKDILRRLTAHETLHDYEARLKAKDGSIRHVQISSNVRWENGEFIHTRCFTRDNTERKRAELELHEANEVLRAIVESSPLPIAAITSDGNITLWNAAAEDLFGWTAPEVLGKPLPFIPEDKVGEHRAFRARDLQGAALAGVEICRRRKDGSPVHLLVSTAPMRSTRGQITGIVSVYLDITERKRAEIQLRRKAEELQRSETALKESEERLRLALEAGKIGAWDWDRIHNRVEWSPRVYELHGVAPGAFGGTVEEFVKIVHPDDQQRVAEAIRNALEDQAPYNVEFRVIHSTGQVNWIATTARVLYDEQGRPARMLGTSMDLTDRKRAEENLQQVNRALMRSNADLERFAFAASHDMQEPLRMIMSYSQLLERRYKGKLDEQADVFLGYIQSGTRRMNSLIEGLLSYSQILHAPAEQISVDCNALLEEVLENCRTLIDEHGAAVTYRSLPTVLAAGSQLGQVFQNLIANAVKYHKPEQAPQVLIDAAQTADDWIFSVQDNGIGIAPEYHKQIFVIFKRLHGREFAGTGIGLSLCQRIVEGFGGRIWVESQEGAGSTFHFTVPKHQCHTATTTSA